MKRFLSNLWEKISNFLKWSPMTYVHSLQGVRLKMFGIFYERTLRDNVLPYIYIMNTLLSFSALILYIIYNWLDDAMLHTSKSLLTSFSSVYIFSMSAINILYHLALLAALKVNCLKKKLGHIMGILHLISFITLHLLLSYFAILISFSSIGVASAIFQSSVVTVYFQNSFLVSLFLWLVVTTLYSVGYLLAFSQSEHGGSEIVSCPLMLVIGVKKMCKYFAL